MNQPTPERIRFLADALPQLVWTADASGLVNYYNSRAAEYAGIEPTSDGRWEWQPVVHPDELELTLAAWRGAVDAGSTYQCEHRVRMADGEFRWHLSRAVPVVERGEIVQWFGTATDIHSLKLAEQTLRDSAQYFRAMADSAPAMLWTSEPDGSASFLSRGWYEFTGRTPADSLGRGWRDVVHPDDWEAGWPQLVATIQAMQPFSVDCRFRTADGSWKWVNCAGQPRVDAAGQFAGYIGSVVDIHARKQHEQALQEADRRKDEFLAALAHELRNPLAPIRNGLELLRDVHTDATSTRLHAMLDRQVSHMVRLVDDLLELSRISRGEIRLEFETTSIAQIVDAACETAQPHMTNGAHTLNVHLPAEDMRVHADPVRMAQAIANILNNAAKYSDRGGDITLHVAATPTDVTIDVEDTGRGIPPAMLERIFDMFTQVGDRGRNASAGLGIGLALVRRVIELHGGRVHAFSEGEGSGSRFMVSLPRTG